MVKKISESLINKNMEENIKTITLMLTTILKIYDYDNYDVRDRIRIAFNKSDEDTNKANLIIQIYKLYSDDGSNKFEYTLYENEDEFHMSKTRTRMKSLLYTTEIIKSHNFIYAMETVNKIIAMSECIVDYVEDNLPKITFYIDQYGDEPIPYNDYTEDKSIQFPFSYLMNEIKYDIANQFPIDFIIEFKIILHANDPEYMTEMKYYANFFGLYDGEEYGINIDYNSMNSETFSLENKTTWCNTEYEFTEFYKDFFQFLIRLKHKLYYEGSDKIEYKVLSRVF